MGHPKRLYGNFYAIQNLSSQIQQFLQVLIYNLFNVLVYFDQQTHAWAWIRMVENDKKSVHVCMLIAKNGSSYRKKYETLSMYEYNVLDNFRAFFIVFDHVKACASMCFLVEMHNIMFYAFWLAQKDWISKAEYIKDQQKLSFSSLQFWLPL